jgi:type IV pilus assembly protein PilY1
MLLGMAGLVIAQAFFAPLALAQTTVAIAQVPLLALKSAPGLVLLTLSRDQRLFYAAYNDSSDLDGDGVIDVGFKPSITYYGYFVPERCYAYDSSNGRFSPKSLASATDGCFSAPSSARWHGNWLNWATMSRMDALRRVLYGGYRVDDPTSSTNPTVLQGAYIPRDAHVWGKEYRPVSGRDLNVYLIQNYTALSAPTTGKQHLFIVKSDAFSSTPSDTGTTAYPFPMPAPRLRVITNVDQSTERIWDWAAGDGADLGADTYAGKASTAYTIKVEACVALSSVRETGCTGYPSASPTIWKPTGTLHDYALNNGLKFGLLTGSYKNNYSGGVVRRNIASFNDEVTPATGVWRQVTEGSASVDGIARTIDRLSIYGTDGSSYYCGSSFTAARNQGVCQSWGAPVSEMMYEGLRYFSGKSTSTSAFSTGLSTTSSADRRLRLPLMGSSTSPWANPFRATSAGGNPICSRPVQMVIADPVTSYDSDQLPGSYFGLIGGSAAVTTDLTGWGATTLSTVNQELWNLEGLGTRNIYIGQSGTVSDGNPTAKSATTFHNIRGHAPDGAMAQGSYYAAAVARFGRTPGITIGAPTGTPAVAAVTGQKVDTISVALGTVVPKIRVPMDVARTRYASIVPIAKSVANLSINKAPGQYQATGTITGFYLDYSYNTTGSSGPDYSTAQNGGRPIMSFVVNFSDSDEGTDNESDAIVRYTVSVNAAGNLLVRIDPVATNIAGIQMQIGYAISGTTKDGLYLDMRTQASSEVYYLDTLISGTPQDPAPVVAPYRTNASALPATATTRTLTFNTSGSTSADFLPRDPLWYAAKYGGAGIMDANGDPTNYFKITSPANLPDQMGKAFRSAAALAAVASTSVVGVGQRSLGTAAIYQANYDSLTWSSRVYAFPVSTDGSLNNTAIWEASAKLPAPSATARNKLFLGRGGTSVPVALTSGNFTSLTSAEQADFGDANTYAYLIGDKTTEERKGGTRRNRGTTAAADYGSVLGDIVNSDPQIISKKDYGYTASDATYAAYWSAINFETLAVGSNDGFFHIFDAEPDSTGGGELLGFMPQAARTNIKDLADPGYQHRYGVDGSIGMGHAKIAVPGDATESWRTVVVAGGGAGAKTVFAVNASSKTFTANSILWELNASSTVASAFTTKFARTFGNIMGRPGIGKLNDGTWVAIFGNGFNSTSGVACLYVVRLDTGAIIRIIQTNTNLTTGTDTNGLGSTELVRKTTGDQDTIEFVYGADYKGNIWRFDPNDGSASASGSLIYSTPTGRPITAEIRVGAAPSHVNTAGGKMIYFGTGSYLSATDSADTTSQRLYGIFDATTSTSNTVAYASEASLTSMAITAAAGADVRQTATVTAGSEWYTTSTKRGWYVPLSGTNITAGERVIAPPVRYTVSGVLDAFLFTSIVPSTSECEAGLDAWISGVDAMTGGYKKVFNSFAENSVRIRGGSPRGVFVLQDGGAPTLYISQTIFNGTIATTSFTTATGGSQTVNINGVAGTTRIISVGLTGSPAVTPTPFRQVWRQLK